MQELVLTQGKFALVDDVDYEKVKHLEWYAMKCSPHHWYAANARLGFLHDFLMNPPEGMEVDHIDGDGLNCQRYNMRNCTHQVNSSNRHIRTEEGN